MFIDPPVSCSHRISALRVFLLAPFLLSTLSIAARAEEPAIASRLQPFVEKQTLAGAVTLVASKEKVLSLQAAGYSDIAAQKPMQTSALFWIASQSKPMTATALMMLVDEGKVNVNDPVEKYLPEFKGQMVQQDASHLLSPVHPITVKNILSHTSGMAFSSPMEKPTLDGLPLHEAVRSYAMMPLQFQPDSKYQYSNAGINTAGRIIEVVSGMSYEAFMDERLFKPLGMKETTFWPNEEQIARIAKSYKPSPEKDGLVETTVTQLKYPLNDRTRQPVPAGGLFSTASDVGIFCRMILNNGILDGKRYLSEASVKQMTSKQTAEALKDGYGFGWSTSGDSFGHGGAYSTNMNINPKSGLITLFMVQHAGFHGDGGQAQGVFNKAAIEAFGK
ncbi:MAG: estB 1 [Chthoniobacteraceae bacterium]|nr:estB 1 [Chthoniobacteraceae bacterium]